MVGDVIMKINLIVMTCTHIHIETFNLTTRDGSFSYTRNYFTTHGNRKREVAVNWSSGEKLAHRYSLFVVCNRLIYHSICLTHIEKLLHTFLLFFDRYKLLIISLDINRLPRLQTHMSRTLIPLKTSHAQVFVSPYLVNDVIRLECKRIFHVSFCFMSKTETSAKIKEES